MQVVWAMQEPPERVTRSIFLAGPTPRAANGDPWRARALTLLQELGYDGVVYIPEPEDGAWRGDYLGQIAWEERCLNMADVIVFWVPRELETMPAFTTNIEWGMWYDSGKVVLGSPPNAPKMRYLHAYADRLGIPQANTLRQTLAAAVELVGEGALRTGGQREVPLHIWRTAEFEAWRECHEGVGRRIDGARVRWAHRDSHGHLFAWALQANVHIPEEDRNKTSEVILARPDTASVLAYLPAARVEDVQVVLVREFRTASTSADGYVWELPGGSTFDQGVAPRAQAAEELEEETGVAIDPERFQAHGARQCAGTFLTHHAHLFSVELTPLELSEFEGRAGETFGVSDSERTTVHVKRVGDIARESLVDWSVLGMLYQALG